MKIEAVLPPVEAEKLWAFALLREAKEHPRRREEPGQPDRHGRADHHGHGERRGW